MKICHALFFVVFTFSALAEDTNAPSSRQAREFDWVRHWATGTPSTNLVRLIAGTDRIVVTNRMASGIAQYRGFNLTLSGGETRKIVRDVSSMVLFSSTRPPTGKTNAIFAFPLLWQVSCVPPLYRLLLANGDSSKTLCWFHAKNMKSIFRMFKRANRPTFYIENTNTGEQKV